MKESGKLMRTKNNSNILFLLKLVISLIFLISTLGKLFYPLKNDIINSLFTGNLQFLAYFSHIFIIFAELIIVYLIWSQRKLLLVHYFSLMLSIFYTISNILTIDCGCFGRLPYLSSLNFNVHYILLVFIGVGSYILYVNNSIGFSNKINGNKHKHWLIILTFSYIGLFCINLLFPKSNYNINKNWQYIEFTEFSNSNFTSDSTVIIDVRPSYFYNAEHLLNSINIPFDIETTTLSSNYSFPLESTIIIYCGVTNCRSSEILASKFYNLGYSKIKILKGNLNESIVYQMQKQKKLTTYRRKNERVY
ncbi:rhodanese-like domain-containing protein [bacterium]|nr:rhodanese-like domain-containing protein [bacterium]